LGVAGDVVRTPVAFDEAAGPARIGVVLFDEDVTSEDDLAALRGDRTDVAVHVARMPLPLDHSPAGLAHAAAHLAAAAATLAPSARLDAVCYSCTTGTLELGLAGVAEALARGRPGVPAATPITGAVKALKALGASRISLLAPYADHLTALIVDHLAHEGVRVVRRAVLEVGSEIDFERVSADTLRAAAHAAMSPDAEALFISCTALRATRLIEELEAALAVPVLTSTQAMWWEALGLAGAVRRGPGRIFSV
jgi:maleate isomerase